MRLIVCSTFTIRSYSRTDPSASPPPGWDTLVELVPCGRVEEMKNQDWRATQSQARRAFFQRLAELGMTDLESHLKFEASHTPYSWLKMYNLTKGAAFGSISYNFLQIRYLRPQNSTVTCILGEAVPIRAMACH